MSKRLITLMAALLVLGFAYAGCGGDDEPAATDTVTDTVTDDQVVTDDEIVTDTETVTDTTDTTETTPTTPDDNGGASAPNLEQAIASCKQAVTSYPQLSGDTKSQLEDLCEQAGSGDREDAQEIGREVCKKVVEDLYPSGVPGKDQALDACERNVQ